MTWLITSPRWNGMQKALWWCTGKGRPGHLGPGVRSCRKCFDRQGSRSSVVARWRLAHICWSGQIARCATPSARRCTAPGERCPGRKPSEPSVEGKLQQQMQQRGILVKAVSMSGLAEEAGLAYKNISDVVESVERAGITKKVLELRPIGNIKG